MSEHISVGIDVGMETTKVVILKGEGNSYESIIIEGGVDSATQQVTKAISQTCVKAGIVEGQINTIVSTGTGKDSVTKADRKVSEFICLAKGIDFLLPSTRTLLDLGARKSLAARCHDGKVTKMATSGKCASGTGIYLQVVSNLFMIKLSEMDELFLKSENDLEIQSPCAVFVESEIISLVHNGVKTEDIVSGVIRGLAGRLYSQLLDIGIEKDVALVGGMANSRALISALGNKISINILVPENPDVVGALGAAIIGRELWSM